VNGIESVFVTLSVNTIETAPLDTGALKETVVAFFVKLQMIPLTVTVVVFDKLVPVTTKGLLFGPIEVLIEVKDGLT
jgi:hypothetical protein